MDKPSIKFDTIIYQSACSTVTKGVIEQGGSQLPIIKKELNARPPNSWDTASLQHECQYLKILQGKAVPALYEIPAELAQQYGLTGRDYLLLAFAGDDLQRLIAQRKTAAEHAGSRYHIPLPVFFTITRQIVQNLMTIHHQNIIQKDINPSNIVYDAQRQQVCIIDFGLSTQINREQRMQVDLKQLQGTLPYLAPEQSGRINRPVDYRSDYYSLGLTLYALLTGESPYQVDAIHDPMAWVHAHIAQQPTPPEHLNPEIPRSLSNIILKLINKGAEQRYQNGHTLLCDLQACLTQIDNAQQSGDHLADLPALALSGMDIPAHLTLPQRLYGREREIKTLLNAFDSIRTGAAELLLVTGYAGVGKSALVHEVKQRLGKHQGFFISGKFDQLQRHIPYSALVQAFQSLIAQIHLCGSEKLLEHWRGKIQTALGSNGRLLTDLIPKLAQLIGAQPEVPELNPEAAKNRFEFTLKAFFEAITSQEYPLILFLDDLQWSDASTLRLLEDLMIYKQIGFLLLIGAYRDHAIDAVHPLTIALQEILEKSAKPYYQLHLQPLRPETVQEILKDTFHQAQTATHKLSELMYRKTKGNPFFLFALLTKLYHDKLINFDGHSGQWSWHSARIKQADISDNVVEFLIQRIQVQPQDSQKTLRFAACMGNQFDLHTLALIREQPTARTARQLQPALVDEIIIPLNDFYRFAENPEAQDQPVVYQFAHDRIQQAAYALIAQQEKGPIHYQLAQLLEQKWDAQKKQENYFTLVEHFNIGREQITTRADKDKLAAFNLTAAEKAKHSTAYGFALAFLKIADDLLADDAWVSGYNLRLAVSNQLIETYFLCGEYEKVNTIFRDITAHAENNIDQFMAFKTIISAYFAQNLLGKAIDAGLYFLRLFGLKLPRKPNRFHLLIGVLKMKLALRQWDNAHLISLPEMQDPSQLALIEILSRIGQAAYSETPHLVPLGIFHMLGISLRFGNTGLSCFVYAACGLVFSGVLQEYNQGEQLGRLALALLKKRDEKQNYCKTILIYYAHIHHWKNPLKITAEQCKINYCSGKETADIEYASASLFHCVTAQYFSGNCLLDVKQGFVSNDAAMQHMGQQQHYNFYQLHHQLIDHLIYETSEPFVLSGKICQENKVLTAMQNAQDNTGLAFYYVLKLMLSFIFNVAEYGKSQYINAEKYIASLAGLYHIPSYFTFSSLTLLTLHESGERWINHKPILFVVNNNQKKLRKMAHLGPMNCLHKWRLVEAERLRLKRQPQQAALLYNQAIAGAKKNGYIQEAAIGNELAANFYLQQGNSEIAFSYLSQARDCYHHWGAMAKVKQMEQHYPELPAAPRQ